MIPTGKNVLVKPYPSNEFSEGGLLIPDTAKKPSNKVFISEVGELVTRVKKGQTGFRVKDWGQEVLIDDELYFIMNEAAIIATL